ncbi:hypothetical protein ACFWHQ_13370 [Streptomyces sp. NPDC060334]|uniref:hypothetical protein n=1 Tax=Streptomyces sp. NPDC060334 TaxID=3347099 RepID=UPI003666C26B
MTVVVGSHVTAGVAEEEWVVSLGEYLTEDIDELEVRTVPDQPSGAYAAGRE